MTAGKTADFIKELKLSYRSIIEINHDYADTIAKNRDEFIKAIIYFCLSHDEQARADLKKFGIRTVGTRHHTDHRSIPAQEGEYKS